MNASAPRNPPSGEPDPRGVETERGFRAILRRWLRVLWVCRVSAASALAGFLLLTFVQQVRDLFLDFPLERASIFGISFVGSTVLIVVGQALIFSLLALVFWVVPVHSAARYALLKRDWLKPRNGAVLDPAAEQALRKYHATAIEWVPRLLGASCFLGILAALGAALDEQFDGQANAISIIARWGIAIYIAATMIGAAVFLGYALSRRALINRFLAARFGQMSSRAFDARERVERGHADADKRVESLLLYGIFAVQIILLAVPGLIEPLLPRAFLLPVLLGVWIPLLAWLGRRSHASGMPLILIGVIAISAANYVFRARDTVTMVALSGNGRSVDAQAPQLSLGEAVRLWRAANGCPVAVDPQADRPEACPSPIIVATAGGASRAAFMTAATLGLFLDATCTAEVAVSEEDKAKSPFRNAALCAEKPLFANRLFAISSVSGGSIGAAVFARALRDGVAADGRAQAPCRAEARSDLWFGGTQPGGWRACLQAILAEDFLSPVVAGLAFRDVLSFIQRWLPGHWSENRGDRIERAMVEAYAKFVRPPGHSASDTFGLARPFGELRPSADAPSIWRPLLILNATHVESGRRAIATHLAPCFKVQRKTGNSDGNYIRLFVDSYDIHDWLAGASATSRSCADPARGQQAVAAVLDLTLVSAAHNSARFPLISPAGTMLRGQETHARLVDGGYFENYGAAAAVDLVDALIYDHSLMPFVILITNDPSDSPKVTGRDHWARFGPPPANTVTSKFFETVTAVTGTILNTRSARGSHAVNAMRALLDPIVNSEIAERHAGLSSGAVPRSYGASCIGILRDSSGAPSGKEQDKCFAHISVPETAITARDTQIDGAKSRPVSMSWWLSKPVQEYLDDMVLCANPGELDRICKVIAAEADGNGKRLLACREAIAAQQHSICPKPIPTPADPTTIAVPPVPLPPAAPGPSPTAARPPAPASLPPAPPPPLQAPAPQARWRQAVEFTKP